jgi:hypothetical protein
MSRRCAVAVSLVVLVVSFALVGCDDTGAGSAPPEDTAARRPSAMGVDMRREAMPSSFPIEVPVVDGRVEHAAEVEGESSVWMYELEVDLPVADVAEWYRMAYASARWTLLEDETIVEDGGESSLLLAFVKGSGAETILHLRKADGGGCAVRASVALGVLVQPG